MGKTNIELNEKIKIIDKRKHSKASETYLNVEFNYNGNIWKGWIPIEYRRTGLFLEKEEEIIKYLNKVYDELNPKNYKNWLKEQEEFWKTKNAKVIEILLQWSNQKADCSKLQHQGYADLFLGELYKQYGLAERKWSDANRAVVDILQYIRHNLGATLTLDDAAYRIGYSKNHFAKLFRDAVGQPFREYVSTQRVERAKELIEQDTSRTIVDIA